MTYELSKTVEEAFRSASMKAILMKTEFVSPELLLYSLLENPAVKPTMSYHIRDYDNQKMDLVRYARSTAVILERKITAVSFTEDTQHLLSKTTKCPFLRRDDDIVDALQLLFTIYNDPKSFAGDWLRRNVIIPRRYRINNILQTLAPDFTPKNLPKERKPCPDMCSYITPDSPDGWHLVGRGKEIERAITVLCRRSRRTPVLIGEHGVGKSAIVRGIAERLEAGNAPARLRGKRILQLDLSAAIAGTPYRGDLEKKLKELLEGVVQAGDVILFIDNIHNLAGAGRLSESTIDSVSMIAPYIESGQLSVIGTSTFGEYRVASGRNRSFSALFQTIEVSDQDPEETREVLELHRRQLESFHGVKYTDQAVSYAVDGSERFIPGGALPGKAIDLLDEAGAAVELRGGRSADRPAVMDALSLISGVDLSEGDGMNEDIRSLRERLLGRIYGQGAAVETVCRAVYSSKAGLSDPLKPLSSLLFVGPTGVGKTQLAKELASFMHVPLERIDMSEYGEKHSVSKLLGTTAGYIGYEDGGILTDAVRKHPYCVLLLDEIEKAHPDIFNLLLQVMDYGTITDGMGIKASFRNVILIMTSNSGARDAHRASIGFGSVPNAGEAMKKEVRKVFAPEFLNRLSATVVFNDMTMEMAGLILDAKLKDLEGTLSRKGISLECSDEARAELLRLGFSPEYGAREMERIISNRVSPLLVDEILFGKLTEGGHARLEFTDGNFSLETTPPDKPTAIERLLHLVKKP